MKQTFYFLTLAFTCVLGLASTASAQITWGTSVNMFQNDQSIEETFVNTDGVGLVGFNATAGTNVDEVNLTVNGVAFTGTGADTPLVGVDGHSITVNGGNNNESAFQDGEFTGNAVIFHLIRGGIFSAQSVTLDGLVVGTDYSVQVFTNDARSSRNNLFMTGFGDGTGSTEPVGFSDLNNSPPGTMVDPDTGENVTIPAVFPDSEVGDSITGTFTATSTSLTFNLFGSNSDPALFAPENGRAQVNGIQLRDVSNVGDIVMKGDVDLSGEVNLFDISPFIAVLTTPGAFQAEADVDCSGEVNLFDIASFIAILTGQTTAP